jgi:hypothetical protein
MEKEFVTYKQALALEELGFNEHCIGWYNPQVNYKEVTTDRYWAFHLTGDWENFKPAPLYQQAFRWFREKHKLNISVGDIYGDYTKWSFGIAEKDKGMIVPFRQSDIYYNTYEEAELECLNKLIEIVKNK